MGFQEVNKREIKLGEIRKNKDSLGNYKMKIIEYKNKKDIWIEFQDEHKAKVHTEYKHFLKGNVKNPYHPYVYDVGYIGQGKYKSRGKDGKKTEAYIHWKNMIQRCYNPYYLNKHPTYIDCYVCEEWHNFQVFAEWWYKHIYNCNNEVMCLDKDILVKGNKIYSPETCIIVPHRINVLFVKCNVSRGVYPIGIDYNKSNNKLRARCSTLDRNNKIKSVHLGYFPLDKPFQAFTCYKQFKENYIKQIADEYKDLIPKKLYDALYKYEVEIND